MRSPHSPRPILLLTTAFTLGLPWSWGFAAAQTDPMTLTPTQDATVCPTRPSGANHHATEQDLMIYGPKHGSSDFRSLLQFDLKELPKRPVRAAILRFTLYKCWSARKTKRDILRVHRLVRPWAERGVGWTRSLEGDEWINKGGDFDPRAVAGTYVMDADTGEEAGKTIDFDVTALVHIWQSGRIPNYGLIVMNVDGDSKATVRPYSRDAKAAGSRPKLILHWRQAPERDPNWIKPGSLKPHGRPVIMRVKLGTKTLNQARVGVKFRAQLKAKGGLAPYQFKLRGKAPEGMALSEEGVLEGTPKTVGRFRLSISIRDQGAKSGSGLIDLVVAKAAAADDPKKEKPAGTDADTKPESQQEDDEEE